MFGGLGIAFDYHLLWFLDALGADLLGRHESGLDGMYFWSTRNELTLYRVRRD